MILFRYHTRMLSVHCSTATARSWTFDQFLVEHLINFLVKHLIQPKTSLSAILGSNIPSPNLIVQPMITLCWIFHQFLVKFCQFDACFQSKFPFLQSLDQMCLQIFLLLSPGLCFLWIFWSNWSDSLSLQSQSWRKRHLFDPQSVNVTSLIEGDRLTSATKVQQHQQWLDQWGAFGGQTLTPTSPYCILTWLAAWVCRKTKAIDRFETEAELTGRPNENVEWKQPKTPPTSFIRILLDWYQKTLQRNVMQWKKRTKKEQRGRIRNLSL